MPMPPLVLRLDKGSPLTPAEMDQNLKYLRDFNNALEALFNVALNPDGTLKTGSINNLNQISDRLITNAKLNWLYSFFGTAAGTNAYTLALNPTTGFTQGDGATTSLIFAARFTNANTVAATLNVNGAGVFPIVKNGTTALVAGDIPAGAILILAWDGANYQIIGRIPNASGLVNLGTGVDGVLGTDHGGTGGPGRAFHANLGGSNTVFSVGAAWIIPWTATLFDVGSRFDLGTDRYSVDVAGKYHFHASSVTSANGGGEMTLFIYKNAVAVAACQLPVDIKYPVQVSTLQDAAVGDVFDCRITQTISQSISGDVTRTFFCGHRIIA